LSCKENWAEIHQALPSKFSLLVKFLFGKVLVKNRDSRVLKLVNLNPGMYLFNLKALTRAPKELSYLLIIFTKIPWIFTLVLFTWIDQIKLKVEVQRSPCFMCMFLHMNGPSFVLLGVDQKTVFLPTGVPLSSTLSYN
jgi:hypothetical protein